MDLFKKAAEASKSSQHARDSSPAVPLIPWIEK
jgi:replication-associated recombination protein RarA